MPTQIPLVLPHRESLSRDDLVVSPSNRLAVEAVDSWPHWHHSVLTIVGPAGSGKTHLVNAFLEMSGARLITPDVAREGRTGPSFALALDDLDRCDFTERELFGMVNAARLGGGTLLITSRVPPEEVVKLPDLRSRLAAATRATLSPPDDELLLAVLAKLFADRQLQVSYDQLGYLVDRMERSLDAARRLVASIDKEALGSRGKIGPRLFRRVLDREAATMCHQTVVPGRYPSATED